MTHHNFDSRNADKFVVRLPDGLRDQVDSVAVAQSTSMNSIFIRSVQQFLDGQNRQELLLNALAAAVTTQNSGSSTGQQSSVVAESMHIDDRIKQAAAETDPRNIFIKKNPIGASPGELEKDRNGFIDERTHADYLVFLAGYRAALEQQP